jgi:hypothetical protein
VPFNKTVEVFAEFESLVSECQKSNSFLTLNEMEQLVTPNSKRPLGVPSRIIYFESPNFSYCLQLAFIRILNLAQLIKPTSKNSLFKLGIR